MLPNIKRKCIKVLVQYAKDLSARLPSLPFSVLCLSVTKDPWQRMCILSQRRVSLAIGGRTPAL